MQRRNAIADERLPKGETARRVWGLGLAALLALWAGVGIPLQQGGSPDWGDMLLAAAVLAMLAPATVAMASRVFDPLSPLPVMGALHGIYFAYRALHLRYGDPLPHELAPSLVGEYDEWFEPTMELALAAWLAALLAYLSPLGSTIARAMPPIPVLKRDVLPERALALWAVGLAGRFAQVVRGTHLSFAKPENVDQGVQGVVDYVSRLAVIGFFVMVAMYYRKRLPPWLGRFPLLVMLPVEIAWGLLTGSRLQMIFPLIWWLIARHYFHERIRLSQVSALGALLVFIVIPLGAQVRSAQSQVSGRDVTTFDVDRSVAAARQAQSNINDVLEDDFARTALRGTSSRFHGVDSVMACLKHVPARYAWEAKDMYLQLPALALVPRFIWPSKPLMNAVPDFNARYWGLKFGDPTSVAVSNIGSLYVAFGWWGAVVGLGVLGIIWRFLYEYFRVQGGVAGTVIFLNLLIVIIAIESDVPGVYSALLKTLVFMLAVVRVLAPAGKRTNRRAEGRPSPQPVRG